MFTVTTISYRLNTGTDPNPAEGGQVVRLRLSALCCAVRKTKPPQDSILT
jgi:hypothetical protein